MKISIIVTVYNSEDYLERCLNSLIKQTYKNIEIVIVNDGSTDKSYQIISEYQKKDKRVKIINQENKGCVVARLNGIKNATGKYCMFIDSDDWIEENTVERLVKKIEITNVDIIKYRFICEPSKKEQENIIYGKDVIFDKLKKENLYVMLLTTAKLNNLANEIVRSELFNLSNPVLNENINQGDDFLINLDLFYKAEKILLTNDIYYHYEKNENSITNSIKLDRVIKNINDLLYVYNIKEKYVEKFGLNNNIEIVKSTELHAFNGIYNQILKVLQCKELQKKDLVKIQENLKKKKFYERIKNIGKEEIKNKNLVRDKIRLNLLNKKLENNYKYRYIVCLYRKLRSKV